MSHDPKSLHGTASATFDGIPRADDDTPRIVTSKGVVDPKMIKSNISHNKQQLDKPTVELNHPLDDGILGTKKGTGKDPVASSWNPKEPFTLLKRNGECSKDDEMRSSEYSTGEVSGTKEVRHICTVNMMASLQCQSVDKDSEENVVDSSKMECNLDNRDTSPSSFTKVKKKKGGKKKNKEARRL
ncbi:hypothetical protein OIU79_007557 [Salix purpurea]|uniref:Uncharacterized protein n=1 Tax=Salix purpurea TaxID=77065 RepID=A0A9Q0TY63_SALPP|nr:hypothetical protein OIU79_007557 [Salix purpurea]